jgi:hypothetical protein
MCEYTVPVEVSDPAIDEAALRRRVNEGIVKRQQLAIERGLDFEGLARGQAFITADDEFPLQDLQLYQDKIRVSLVLTPRPYMRLGFLMPILTRLRQEFHGLVAFYCNLLGQRQILFNERLVQLLVTFSYRLQSTENLASQLATLQRQVETLEHQLKKADED